MLHNSLLAMNRLCQIESAVFVSLCISFLQRIKLFRSYFSKYTNANNHCTGQTYSMKRKNFTSLSQPIGIVFSYTLELLNIGTDISVQKVQTLIRLLLLRSSLIMVFTVCNSVNIFDRKFWQKINMFNWRIGLECPKFYHNLAVW